ncbi:RICIN domain-containing protein [Actinomadura rudentiformis]|uniref:Ricin-type beta-trefoil lectin domain protein n=1 Tax=Actinomadura rudentiformis TaxID=359158 RepID=A0A6H9YH93_9ACTN|nr:RICIN domain-containing protein [Actinomadura rudentiformis]KAB2343325.1 ricin-type beta-trefoil lectin domain protein [Actinomadura rudentiformis]
MRRSIRNSVVIGAAAIAAAGTLGTASAWADQADPEPSGTSAKPPAAKVAGVPGVHYLKPRHAPGVCITVHGARGKGAKVNQYTCLGKKNQKWEITPVRGGWYTLRAQHRGNLCLDIPNRYRKGTQAIVWSCNGRINQVFWIVCYGNQSNCEIRPARYSERTKCLSIKGGSNRENAPLILWKCNKTRDQRFAIR